MKAIRSCSRLALPAAIAACGSAPAPAGFPPQPLETLTSDSGRLSIAIRTSPQPPTRGEQSVEYTITEPATGRPVTGLHLDVVPWMPVMLHGTSIVPSVSEAAPGTYLVANVALFMAGEWVLRTAISGAGNDAGADSGAATMPDDHVTPPFEIP